jgi:hypothetical protein
MNELRAPADPVMSRGEARFRAHRRSPS